MPRATCVRDGGASIDNAISSSVAGYARFSRHAPPFRPRRGAHSEHRAAPTKKGKNIINSDERDSLQLGHLVQHTSIKRNQLPGFASASMRESVHSTLLKDARRQSNPRSKPATSQRMPGALRLGTFGPRATLALAWRQTPAWSRASARVSLPNSTNRGFPLLKVLRT